MRRKAQQGNTAEEGASPGSGGSRRGPGQPGSEDGGRVGGRRGEDTGLEGCGISSQQHRRNKQMQAIGFLSVKKYRMDVEFLVTSTMMSPAFEGDWSDNNLQNKSKENTIAVGEGC